MAFVLPAFNLTADIYTNTGTGPAATPRFTTDCQLRAPEMRNAAQSVASAFATSGMVLLVPAGTDLRDASSAPGILDDFCEVPPGSGRMYEIIRVDDVAKGFANEHRFAIIRKYGTNWPVPMP